MPSSEGRLLLSETSPRCMREMISIDRERAARDITEDITQTNRPQRPRPRWRYASTQHALPHADTTIRHNSEEVVQMWDFMDIQRLERAEEYGLVNGGVAGPIMAMAMVVTDASILDFISPPSDCSSIWSTDLCSAPTWSISARKQNAIVPGTGPPRPREAEKDGPKT